ncbi:hypothetical protein Cgig2_027169 [Carnegiea gigantea]|uniref:Cytosolic oligopeptidase A n=1 Tax=Carnegiea gigantea TaxID=171969 RepID=A0A9Q1KTK2_9CARY|nr:hypothetical protein Cgig2_027169 [Carnegiea gigantea]
MWSRFGFGSSHLFGEIVLCGISMKFERKLEQSKPIYNAFKAIRESPDWKQLSEARKRIVESECADELKDAFLSGVSLEEDKREHFNKIQQLCIIIVSWESMAKKIATVEEAEHLLEKLCAASLDPAVRDLEDLNNFGKRQCATEGDNLTHWHISFWSERLRESNCVLSCDGASTRLPVAHMVCNQTPPVGDKPSLMIFREVEAVFHEFGHALQHVLTTQDEGLVAGIRGIEWDAV